MRPLRRARELEMLAQSGASCHIFVTILRRCGIPAAEISAAFDRSIEMRVLEDALLELMPDLFADGYPEFIPYRP